MFDCSVDFDDLDCFDDCVSLDGTVTEASEENPDAAFDAWLATQPQEL
jgi:hypothetical protein